MSLRFAILLFLMPGIVFATTPRQAVDSLALLERDVKALSTLSEPDQRQTATTELHGKVAAWIRDTSAIIGSFTSTQLTISLDRLVSITMALKVEGVSYQLPPEFLDSWQNRAFAKISEFSAVELEKLIDSFIKIRIKPDPQLIALWQRYTEPLLAGLSHERLTGILQAFRTWKVRPTRDFLEIAGARLLSDADSSAQKTAESLQFLDDSGSGSPEHLQEWLNFLKTKTSQLSPRTLPFALSLVRRVSQNRSLTFTGADSDGAFLRAWQEAAIPLLDQFSADDLRHVIYSFFQMRVAPLDKFSRKWQEVAATKMGGLSAAGLANVLYAISQMGVKASEPFLHAWSSAATRKLRGFSALDICGSLQATALLGYPDSLHEFYGRAFAVASSRFTSLSVPQKHQVYVSWQGLQARRPQDAASFDLPNVSGFLDQAKAQAPQGSLSEDRVGEHLRTKYKRNLSKSVWVDKTASYVDFALLPQNTIIQFDGPDHYFRDPKGNELRQPSDVLQDEILNASGWKVVRIPYSVIQVSSGRMQIDTARVDQLVAQGLSAPLRPRPRPLVSPPQSAQCEALTGVELLRRAGQTVSNDTQNLLKKCEKAPSSGGAGASGGARSN